MKIQQSTTAQNINKARLAGNMKSDTSAENTSFGYKLNNNNDITVISGRHNDKKAQMLEIKAAIRKSNDGSSLIKTFEDALGEIPDPDFPFVPNTKPTPDPDNPKPEPDNPKPDPSPSNTNLGGIVLQLGQRSKDAVRFTFNYSSVGIGDLRNDLNTTTKGLGLNSLSMATEESAAYALDSIDHALNKAAAIMSRFELAQSKIESTAEKLQNPDLSFIFENGDIEDIDDASELLEYIKQYLINNGSDSITAQSVETSQALDLLE